MKNISNYLPIDQLDTGKVAHATFADSKGNLYTFAPSMDSLGFLEQFPNHKRVSDMLDCSGSSWLSKAFIFFTADCFDPPAYLQFGSSFEDAYESFLDNDESLVIPPEDYADYDVETDNPTCSFNSSGEPVDSETIQGFEVKLRSITFED